MGAGRSIGGTVREAREEEAEGGGASERRAESYTNNSVSITKDMAGTE